MNKVSSAVSFALAIFSIALISGCVQQPATTTITTTSSTATTTTLVAPATTTTSQETTTTVQQAAAVTIQNFAFNPSQITVNKGDTVIWTNEDSFTHTVVSDSGSEINSPALSSGQAYSHTFNTAGTFDYHCSLHPSMKGKVIVG